MKVAFKAKPQTIYAMDDTPLYDRVKVPALKRSHVDMIAARQHPSFRGLANSDFFPGMLARESIALFPSGYVNLSELPDGVTVRPVGPLVEVSFIL